MRLGLQEVAGRLRRAPHLFVERAVQRDWRARFRRGHGPTAIRGLELERAVGGHGLKRCKRQAANHEPRRTTKAGTTGKNVSQSMDDGSMRGKGDPRMPRLSYADNTKPSRR